MTDTTERQKYFIQKKVKKDGLPKVDGRFFTNEGELNFHLRADGTGYWSHVLAETFYSPVVEWYLEEFPVQEDKEMAEDIMKTELPDYKDESGEYWRGDSVMSLLSKAIHIGKYAIVPTEGIKLYSEEQVKKIEELSARIESLEMMRGNGIGNLDNSEIERQLHDSQFDLDNILNTPFLTNKGKGVQNKAKWDKLNKEFDNVLDNLTDEQWDEWIKNKKSSTSLDKEGYSKEEMTGQIFKVRSVEDGHTPTRKHIIALVGKEWKSAYKSWRESVGYCIDSDGEEIPITVNCWLEEINLPAPPLQKDKEEMTDEEVEEQRRKRFMEKNNIDNPDNF